MLRGQASGIVTYSDGPWGGTRCAVVLQPVLHELGCLPVSKMVHLPSPQELLSEDGDAIDDTHRMLKQLPEIGRASCRERV